MAIDDTFGFPKPIQELLPDFRLIKKLGEGGMGVVFKAHQVSMDRDVALKILAPSLVDNHEFVERFHREAIVSARLDHPNIVRGFAVGDIQGCHYFAMEFVEGEGVDSWLKKLERLSVGDAVKITLDVAHALDHAHSRHILHRDIKPANIMITRDGEVKLADLGLAKLTEDDSGLTQIGEMAGTPAYMPPEQARNAKMADNRSDIYALGATLYMLVTGLRPFTGKTALDVVEKKEKGIYEPAHRVMPDVPERLSAIIDKMMALEPSRRFQTASELIAALEATHIGNSRLALGSAAGGGETVLSSTATPSQASRIATDRRTLWISLAAATLTIVFLNGGYFVWRRAQTPTKSVAVDEQASAAVAKPAAKEPPTVAAPPVKEVDPPDLILARAVEQVATNDIESGRKTLALGLNDHPKEPSIERPLREIERGVLLLFQYQTPDDTSAVVPMWSADGVTLTQKDNYRFGIITGRPCYVYAFQRDTRPSVARIFPNKDFSPKSNPLPPKQLNWLPSDPKQDEPAWVHLDSSVGQERVYFVAVTKPLRDPDSFGKRLVNGADKVRAELTQNPSAFLQSGSPPGEPCFAQDGGAMQVFQFNHK